MDALRCVQPFSAALAAERGSGSCVQMLALSLSPREAGSCPVERNAVDRTMTVASNAKCGITLMIVVLVLVRVRRYEFTLYSVARHPEQSDADPTLYCVVKSRGGFRSASGAFSNQTL